MAVDIVANGRARETDGLWVHHGKLSVGPIVQAALGGPGDLNVNRGNNTGAIYFGGQDKYLFFNGTNFVFSPPLGTAAIAPGTAQQLLTSYYAASNWRIPQTGVWTETAAQTPSVQWTGAGTTLRIEWMAIIYVAAAGVGLYVAPGMDGGVTWANGSHWLCPIAGGITTISGILYHTTPTSGSHRISLFMYGNAGDGFIDRANSAIYVTEQRA